MKFIISFLIFFGISIQIFGQDRDVSVTGISPELFLNANSVLRDEQITIEVEAVDKMTIYTSRTITVLNRFGEENINAYQWYDDERKVKNQQAIIYNSAGKEIKKFKQKDFKDRSAVSSGTLYSESRVQYLDFTAQDYPYTVVYEAEVRTGTTVFLPPWYPVSGYYQGVERSSYNLNNPKGIPLRKEEKNLEGLQVESTANGNNFSYTIKNLLPFKPEHLSPDIHNFIPHVRVALNEFSLVGVKGKATNWKEFGKWQYDNLLSGRNELPLSTISKVKNLTAGIEDNMEKARIIYQYVQDNTRYISIQLGIGGWEPMPAQDVDRLGYGDCKALTNYTKALLDSQNITSHYAVVFGGERKDIDPVFASMQGNHVILNIPGKDEDVWLECTDQTTPFNYLGDFTDNRNVLLVKPEGGEIVKTKEYDYSENLQQTHTKIYLDESGSFTAEVKRESRGIPYGDIYWLMRETREKQILYYKNRWGHLQNLNVKDLIFENNRREGSFTEKVQFTGQKIASRAGSRLLLPVNFFTVPALNLPRSDERKLPFEIERGNTYKDVFEFYLPEGFSVESIPQEENVENQFGKISVSVQEKNEEGFKIIEVVREYVLYQGTWEAGMYSDFRNFMNKINSFNNQKAVLIAI